jgi:8-oxo-dGTP pyrophosphatase MutT (NUDIX family)
VWHDKGISGSAMHMSNWQRLDTKLVYQNPYLTVHEDNVINPHGKPIRYGWVETSPCVYVIAIDSEDKVYLVKQLRYTTGRPMWELPGGSVLAEDTIEAGKRELEAEVGLHAEKWVSLSGEYHVWSGVATQRNTVMIARDLHRAKNRVTSDDMVDAVQLFTWKEIKDMMRSGELNDGQSIAALTLAGLHLGHFR